MLSLSEVSHKTGFSILSRYTTHVVLNNDKSFAGTIYHQKLNYF